MKLLYLTSRFPYPIDKGDKLRSFYQIKELSKNFDVILVSILDEEISLDSIEAVQVYTKSIYLLQMTPMRRWISLFKAFFGVLPLQIAWFYNRKLHSEFEKIVECEKPDHIFCQLVRMAEYAKNVDTQKTLDYMDCFGVSMIKRSHLVTPLLSWLYKIESKKMINYEEQIAQYFDHLTVISDQDKEQFLFEKAKKMVVVQNGVSDDFIFYDQPTDAIYDFVFVGNMSYLPNIECAEYIVNVIMSHFSDKKLLLSGVNPPYRLRKLASKNITVSGGVDDIRKSYKSGKIFLAPIWSGTGQQNKILEALALGIPCVTTFSVNSAIGAEPDKEILIADDKISFVNAINSLLENPELSRNLSNNGKIFIQKNYSWKQKVQKLGSLVIPKNL